MPGNEIASKINSGFDFLTRSEPPKTPDAIAKDPSLKFFSAVVQVAGTILILLAVWLVLWNFNLLPNAPTSLGKDCNEGLYNVARIALGVFVLLVIGLTLVQGNVEKGEVRKSIAISVMVMFYGLFAIHCQDVYDKNSVIGMLLDKYWVIVVAVTGYYFAARTYEDTHKKPE
jgi:hypothetical protein